MSLTQRPVVVRLAHAWLVALIVSRVAGAQAGKISGRDGPIALKTVVLSDVQGLFGGQSLWIAEDRTAYVETVGHKQGANGLWSTRYKTTLTPADWTKLERLVNEHHFRSIRMRQRPGVPDEAHPTITIVTRSGDTTSVMKWANDKHADFDAIYDYLLELCKRKADVLLEGPYDYSWRPPGFSKP